MDRETPKDYRQQRKSSPLPYPEQMLGRLVHVAEQFGLVIIALATIYAGAQEVLGMVQLREVSLGDLLLLFLYLEVLAMVAIYLESGKLPIRLPLYIAIVALARYLILEMKSLDEWQMVAIGITITLITIATLILRYGHLTFPYEQTRRSTDRFKNQSPNSDKLGTD